MKHLPALPALTPLSPAQGRLLPFDAQAIRSPAESKAYLPEPARQAARKMLAQVREGRETLRFSKGLMRQVGDTFQVTAVFKDTAYNSSYFGATALATPEFDRQGSLTGHKLAETEFQPAKPHRPSLEFALRDVADRQLLRSLVVVEHTQFGNGVSEGFGGYSQLSVAGEPVRVAFDLTGSGKTSELLNPESGKLARVLPASEGAGGLEAVIARLEPAGFSAERVKEVTTALLAEAAEHKRLEIARGIEAAAVGLGQATGPVLAGTVTAVQKTSEGVTLTVENDQGKFAAAVKGAVAEGLEGSKVRLLKTGASWKVSLARALDKSKDNALGM